MTPEHFFLQLSQLCLTFSVALNHETATPSRDLKMQTVLMADNEVADVNPSLRIILRMSLLLILVF